MHGIKIDLLPLIIDVYLTFSPLSLGSYNSACKAVAVVSRDLREDITTAQGICLVIIGTVFAYSLLARYLLTHYWHGICLVIIGTVFA